MAVVDTKRKMLGEMLVAAGLIKDEQLKKALEEQKKRGGKVGEVLVDLGFITEINLASFLGRQLNIPYIEIEKQLVDTETVRLIPAAMARRLVAIPLYKDGDAVVVAAADPLNIFCIDDITKATCRLVRQVVATRSDILKAIDRYYGVTPAMEAAAMDFAGAPAAPAAIGEAEMIPGVAAEDAPVIKMVSMLIAQAIMDRASDIHIDPEGKFIKVRFRIDGVLAEVKSLPREMHAPIVSRIKIMANMDIAEKRMPQDGRFQARVTHTDAGPVVTAVFRERNALRMDGDTTVDIRVSTLPVIQGETVVMRLLDRTQVIQNLEGLNFTAELLERYRKLITRPYGMVLVTGPTGERKINDALCKRQRPGPEGEQHRDGGRSCRIPDHGGEPGAGEPQGRRDLCERPPLDPPSGPGRHHGGRNPRPRDGRDRHSRGAHRPSRFLHAPYQRRGRGGNEAH